MRACSTGWLMVSTVHYYIAPSTAAELISGLNMAAWAIPKYSREQVDSAGATLAGRGAPTIALPEAIAIINNWRASHSFPLNTFQNGLRQRAKRVGSGGIVAQRTKRLSSISAKLKRFRKLNLSLIQDIAGCRAVVSSVEEVNKLVSAYKSSNLKHKLIDSDDYIATPKRSGYRSYHLIYSYFSDRNDTYNGLKIEIQIRSPLQHAWATAVETVGTFIGQSLKSSQGEKDWLRFFSLMGTAIALKEKCNPVPDTPVNRDQLKSEIQDYADRLGVIEHLHAFGTALQRLARPTRDAHYYLLQLDSTKKVVQIKAYRQDQLELASSDYAEAEALILSGQPGTDAVLVSVDSMSALRRAYPNYFADTGKFTAMVSEAIGRPSIR